MLTKILEVQKVGRFERLEASRVTLSQVTLVFGENGWGKSTLADLLRSVTTGTAAIVGGRETLAATGVQKVRFLFEKTPAEYIGGVWSGHRPTIAVYDQCFINENVYSGDAVSLEHLKRQYGLVIGLTGVALVRSIEEISRKISEFDKAFREADTLINTTLRTQGLQRFQNGFGALKTDEAIERLISEKQNEIGMVEKSAEIGRLLLPDLVDVPTDASVFRDALVRGIDNMAAGAHHVLHAHISKQSVSIGVES